MSNLIISAPLSDSPTDFLAFRYVTWKAHEDVNLDVLLLTNKQKKDIYYYSLKIKGGLDFIEYIITPEEKEDGIRLDTELNFPFTIIASEITFQNQIDILERLFRLNTQYARFNSRYGV